MFMINFVALFFELNQTLKNIMKKILQSFIMLFAVLAATAGAHAADSVTVIGDVNNDGNVNITDVTGLISYLLGGGTQENFNTDLADINNDGTVNITDVTALISFVMTGSLPGVDTQPATETFTVNGVPFTMVTVEGGTFTMGASDEDTLARGYEKPAHQVTLSTYSIGQTEVTQSLWRAVMNCNPSYYSISYNGSVERPVERVSWDQCQKFILKLNEMTGKHFRLPTEAEWEFAARGGNLSQGYQYSGSNTIDDVAWYIDNATSQMTYPVATKAPNELGLYDMSGNVAEWCQDLTEEEIHYMGVDHYSNGRYSSEAHTDPVGPATGNNRVLRGGHYWREAEHCRVTTLEAFNPDTRDRSLGLRLVLDQENSTKFRLSETVIAVVAGESKTVDILNSTGTCTLTPSSSHASCSLNGDSFTVTGEKAGITTINVTNGDGETAAVLNVIVTPVTHFIVEGVEFEMVPVEGGTFMRNAIVSNEYREYDWEAPSFSWLSVPDYFIGKTEVTQELWQAVMGGNPSNFKGDLQCPVEQVTWEECQQFILNLNELTGLRFRLPTEAEWEFAARSGNLSQGYQYSGSATVDEVAWYSGNSSNMTHPVGTKAPNELGIHDMTGNVWQWCLDWVDQEEHPYYEGYQLYGATNGTSRVRRGGCWSSSAENSHLLTVSGSAPSDSNSRLGLRLVLEDENTREFHLSQDVIRINVGSSILLDLINGMGNYQAVGGEDNVSCTFEGDKMIVTGLHQGANTVHVRTCASPYGTYNVTTVLTVYVY